MLRRIGQSIKKARQATRCQRGTVAIQIGLMLTVLIGMVSLGTEIPFVLHKHRQLQSAADMAAVSAAATRIDKANLVALNEARAVTASAGLVHGQGGVTVLLSRPPASGRYAGVAEAVEVVINQPQTLDLAKVLGLSNFDMRASAVALQTSVGPYCILALDLGAPASVDVKADAALPNPGCGTASNSASDTALMLGSSSTVKGSTSVRGQIWRAANATLAGSPNTENGPNVDDPYSAVANAPTLPCTAQLTAGPTVNLKPGRFCGGWKFDAAATVNLASGNYVIEKQLKLEDGVTLSGTGVTLFIDGNVDYEIMLGNKASISLTAPVAGVYAGLAIFSGRNAAAAKTHTFGKTVSLNIRGALYFPNQIVELKTNVSAIGGCAQVIARVVRVENSVMLGNSCAGSGTRVIVGAASKLVQ